METKPLIQILRYKSHINFLYSTQTHLLPTNTHDNEPNTKQHSAYSSKKQRCVELEVHFQGQPRNENTTGSLMLNFLNIVVCLGNYPVICLQGLKKTNKTPTRIDTT